jgi:hypothetical protein
MKAIDKTIEAYWSLYAAICTESYGVPIEPIIVAQIIFILTRLK